MLAIALIALLGGAPHHRKAEQPNLASAIGEAAPLFAFANSSHYAGYPAYTGLPASDGCYPAASVTGTKGEALTFTRATTRFCPTSANEATGVMCASGEVCITSSGTTRGISIFRAGTNLALRSEAIDNAAWADVGTPIVTANAYVAPDGATTAETIQDDSAVAREGRSQAISTTSQTRHTFSVWLRASTGEREARITIVGTGNSAGDATCSYYDGSPDGEAIETTWRRVKCTSPAAYGVGITSVTVSVLVGDTVAEVGTIGAFGAMYEVSAPYASPYTGATAGASVTRNLEVALFSNVLPAANFADKYSAAVTWLTPPVLVGVTLQTPLIAQNMFEFQQNGVTHRVYHYPSAANVNDGTVSVSTLSRLSGYSDGTNKAACLEGVCTTAAGTGSFVSGPWSLYVGSEIGGAGTGADGLLSNICISPDSARCR